MGTLESGSGLGSPHRSAIRTIQSGTGSNPRQRNWTGGFACQAKPLIPRARRYRPAVMSGPARYAAILRAPHVTPLLLASMLARLPYGVYALAVILYLSEARDSYAVAGLVDGAFAIGAAVGVPGQGRLIDRFGQRRVLVPAALLDATATVALIALTESGAGTGALVVCGLLGGVAIPSVGGALRALWPSLLGGRADLTGAAFALDSVALEVLFTSGPLLAALVVAVASPVAALGLSAVCTVAGTLLFVAQAPSRGWRPDRGARAGRRRARRAALERRAHARLRRDPRRLRLRHRRDQPARVRRGARQAPSSPASCSPRGRSAAWPAGSSTAHARGRPAGVGSTSCCPSSSRSASSPPCSPARSARWPCSWSPRASSSRRRRPPRTS